MIKSASESAAKSRKRKLTPEQLEVCSRLKALFNTRGARLGYTQETAAEALGISQGAVSHYLNKRSAVGFEAMFRWAELLQVHPYEIDPKFGETLPASLRAAVDNMVVEQPFYAAHALIPQVNALTTHEDKGPCSGKKRD